MNTRNKLLLTSISATLAVTLFSCTSLGTPEDQTMGDSLWESMQGYQSWSSPEDWEGFQESASIHGDYIRIYLNSVMAQNPADPPVGSIVVKEGFAEEDASSMKAITVMQKVEGYGADAGGWFYARYSASGSMTHAGTPAMCTDCHRKARGGDFLFYNDY